MKTFEHEPVPGLPESLPEGEHLIWQGRPAVWGLAKDAFHIHHVALYLSALVGLRLLLAWADGESFGRALAGTLAVSMLAVVCLAILYLLAAAHARTTLYSLTNRRVVLRYGVAFPMMVNLPFPAIVDAGFRARKDGRGDVPVEVRGEDGPSYLHLWPHARPGRIAHPVPMLRSIPQVADVATRLAKAMTDAGSALAPPPERASSATRRTDDDRSAARPRMEVHP